MVVTLSYCGVVPSLFPHFCCFHLRSDFEGKSTCKKRKISCLKSKRRADLKPLMDQNKDHLRRLKSNLHSLNAYSRQQGNSLKELIRLAQVMEKVLKSTAAIVSAKDDVCL